jgi:hypothetical protein
MLLSGKITACRVGRAKEHYKGDWRTGEELHDEGCENKVNINNKEIEGWGEASWYQTEVKRDGRSVWVVQEGQKRKLYEIAGNIRNGKEEIVK